MKYLVTGAAGFIGGNLVKRLLQTEPDAEIVGLDNVNDYYDVNLKFQRLDEIASVSNNHNWTFNVIK